MPFGVIINKTGKSSYFPVAERWKLWEMVSHSCSWNRYWNLLWRISSLYNFISNPGSLWVLSEMFSMYLLPCLKLIVEFACAPQKCLIRRGWKLTVEFTCAPQKCLIRRGWTTTWLFRAKEVGRKALLFSFLLNDVLRRTVLPNRTSPVYHAKAKLNLLETQHSRVVDENLNSTTSIKLQHQRTVQQNSG